jgi:hypothetical protein
LRGLQYESSMVRLRGATFLCSTDGMRLPTRLEKKVASDSSTSVGMTERKRGCASALTR